MIEDLLKKWDYLNEVLVPAYMTTDGREIYDRSLSLCTQKFPQYVEELQGIADGSKASFSKVCVRTMWIFFILGNSHSTSSKASVWRFS